MSNSPNQIPVFIHPAIKNLNVRQISKIIASKIIEKTELNLQYNSLFCTKLNVATDFNTYEAVAYYIDNQYFEKYGFKKPTLINIQTVYEELFSDFSSIIKYELSF